MSYTKRMWVDFCARVFELDRRGYLVADIARVLDSSELVITAILEQEQASKYLDETC